MKRLHADHVRTGVMDLSPQQSRHARDVLRLKLGGSVEVFDAAGQTGSGVIVALEPCVQVRIESILEPARPMIELTIASAVPKGDRADWLVEKISEIGVAEWIPLQTARSVVHPEGAGKLERWHRIAIEAAKQCRRPGTLRITPLTPLHALLGRAGLSGFFGSTLAEAPRWNDVTIPTPCHILIGPEGGWTPEEELAMTNAGLAPISLGATVLRIETAALVAAGIALARAATR